MLEKDNRAGRVVPRDVASDRRENTRKASKIFILVVHGKWVRLRGWSATQGADACDVAVMKPWWCSGGPPGALFRSALWRLMVGSSHVVSPVREFAQYVRPSSNE